MIFTTVEQVAKAVEAEGMYWAQGGRGANRYYKVQVLAPQVIGKTNWLYNKGETVCQWSTQKEVLDWANAWLA
jgi:hypothetical protein